jgi:3,4-dihydroxyphenylacetate 2,3-dioxygenase
VPPLVMSEADRREMNHGQDTSLVAGLGRLRTECLEPLEADTIVVLDTHWFTTVEHVITAHDRRTGTHTSEELPRGVSQIPYDFPGDRELANAVAAQAEGRSDTWILAADDPHLPIRYATVILVDLLQAADERWVSVSTCQTGETDDFLMLGELLGEAIAGLDRRVVLLGSGGLSHRFWPLRQFRDHEAADPIHIRTPEARAADEQVINWLNAGDHAAGLDFMPEFLPHGPEGRFAHYLIMAGALGGPEWKANGRMFGEYESVSGTGQAHIWFDI